MPAVEGVLAARLSVVGLLIRMLNLVATGKVSVFWLVISFASSISWPPALRVSSGESKITVRFVMVQVLILRLPSTLSSF